MLRSLLFLLAGLLITTPLYADQVLTTEKPADNVYALVGPITNRIP